MKSTNNKLKAPNVIKRVQDYLDKHGRIEIKNKISRGHDNRGETTHNSAL